MANFATPPTKQDRLKTLYPLGTHVVCIEDFGGLIKKGMTGKVMKVKEDGNPPVGIVWDHFVGGHDLTPSARYGIPGKNNGYFVPPENIKAYRKFQFALYDHLKENVIRRNMYA